LGVPLRPYRRRYPNKPMSHHNEHVKPTPPAAAQPPQTLALDTAALEAARGLVRVGPTEAADHTWRAGLIKLLNDALATELVCVLRYKRHHYTAHGLASPRIAEEFAVHAGEEMVHAERLARRIVQMGGQPDFAPDTLTKRSHASYNEALQLKDMILANLVAEHVAIEAYGQMVRLAGDRDPTTRRLLEDILADEQKHADELQGWLSD
jgi:bacterioferritin